MSFSAPRRRLAQAASTFVYPEARISGDPSAHQGMSDTAGSSQAAEERDRRRQAELFEQGRQAAQKQLSSELTAVVQKERERVARALEEFAQERHNYYRRVEGEVVQLALAIARKILHREAQIDPQVLPAIVRVTLESLDAGTQVNLRVHPQDAPDWRHFFACQMGEMPSPEVHEDAAMERGECRIETSVGATDLGLASQLKEIETGLLDLLAERPGIAAETSAQPGTGTNSRPPSAVQHSTGTGT